jgi:hypothetical protein
VARDGTPGRWWAGDPTERFWLEITDRDDFGVDLHAPAEREGEGAYWSYAFVREVREGDIVLHYRTRPAGEITHWSRAVGEPYPDQVYWGAHGQAGGRGPVTPYWRPGWRRPLEGPYPLPEPVTKHQLRKLEVDITWIYETLRMDHPGAPLYFPFQLSSSRPLRAFQGYLAKFPDALIDAIPQLVSVRARAATTTPQPEVPAPAASDATLGAEYRHVNPNQRTEERDPFTVDPDVVDRGLAGHAATQEALADAVLAAGLLPRSPQPGEPTYDLAWEDAKTICVAEVKSITDRNEERQLRLALGQVLRYAYLLRAKGRPVRPIIVAEREPADMSWVTVCEAVGVRLVWPAAVESLFAAPRRRREEA